MPRLTEIKDRSPRWVRDGAITLTRKFGLLTAQYRVMPDFLVVGAKRGGSTSLFNYLMMHPGILGLYPRPRLQKSTDFFFREYSRGEKWYRSNFHTAYFRDHLASRLGYLPLSGEASPYYIWDPRVARRAYDANPRIKSVMLIRNPVSRAFSHWQERTLNGVEPLSFSDALAAEEERTVGELERMLSDPEYYSFAHDWYSYRARGVYLPQLENWRAVFPDDQLLVLRSEELYTDTQGTFDRVCKFLGIPIWTLPEAKQFNASPNESMPADCKSDLESYYKPYNKMLEQYVGFPLAW